MIRVFFSFFERMTRLILKMDLQQGAIMGWEERGDNINVNNHDVLVVK